MPTLEKLKQDVFTFCRGNYRKTKERPFVLAPSSSGVKWQTLSNYPLASDPKKSIKLLPNKIRILKKYSPKQQNIPRPPPPQKNKGKTNLGKKKIEKSPRRRSKEGSFIPQEIHINMLQKTPLSSLFSPLNQFKIKVWSQKC